MIEFIVDNYWWFIIGGIVVLMTIVGYIAEKTDFGRKKITKEKPAKKETKKEKSKAVEEGIGTAGIISEVSPVNENSLTEEPKVLENELFKTETNDKNSSEEVSNDIFANDWNKPIETIVTDNAQVNDATEVWGQENNFEGNVEPIITEVLEETGKGIQDISIEPLDNSAIEISKDNNEAESILPEVELPKIEEVKNKEEEDLWKF